MLSLDEIIYVLELNSYSMLIKGLVLLFAI